MDEGQRMNGRLSWPLSAGVLALTLALPRAQGAGTGTITGTVDQPGPVTKITAVDRDPEPPKPYPGKLDARTGKFVIEGLPLDATYDVIIDAGNVRLEGVNLKVPRS